MSVNGLETFDRSIHATNRLKEISNEIGADRRLAWRVLGAVLRTLRDRLPVEDAAHLAAQLPLVIGGAPRRRGRDSKGPPCVAGRYQNALATNPGWPPNPARHWINEGR